jgi:hypothetical protein
MRASNERDSALPGPPLLPAVRRLLAYAPTIMAQLASLPATQERVEILLDQIQAAVGAHDERGDEDDE